MSADEGMDKENVTYTDNGVSVSLREEGNPDTSGSMDPSEDTPLSGTSESQKGSSCTTPHVRGVWSGGVRRQKAYWWLAGLGGRPEGIISWAQGWFPETD